MSRPNSRASMNCALRSISIILSQYSSGCSAAGLRRMVPPLFTRISMGGHSALHSFNERVHGLTIGQVAGETPEFAAARGDLVIN